MEITFLGVLLNEQQFKALSWIAFCVAHEKIHPKTENYEKGVMVGELLALKTICMNVLNIPHDLIYQIEFHGKIKGLINYNRFSYVAYYESDLD